MDESKRVSGFSPTVTERRKRGKRTCCVWVKNWSPRTRAKAIGMGLAMADKG